MEFDRFLNVDISKTKQDIEKFYSFEIYKNLPSNQGAVGIVISP